jgi:SAM-dependent methyltransferase
MVPSFTGSIPERYDRHLGPVLFEPYARDLAARLPAEARDVLEVAAGTGRATRQLLARLPADARLIATDLNPAMLDVARLRLPADPRLAWQPADAQALPFDDASFDVVACQFGLMFCPDKAAALRELRRVLRPGGTALVTVWDAIAANPVTAIFAELLRERFPGDPPGFFATPFSMGDAAATQALVTAAGFAEVRLDTVALIGEASSAADLAIGLVHGNPIAHEFAARGGAAVGLEEAIAAALAAALGERPCRSPMSAHVVTAVSR